MSKTRLKRPKQTDLTRCRFAYFLELARGRSFISSTRSSATRAAVISEVLDEFVGLWGKDDLPAYGELLADRLQERGDSVAAAEVRERLWPGSSTPNQAQQPVVPPARASRYA